MITATGDVLLQDIIDSPGDDGLRLIYADWLDEFGGEAERSRAELIRRERPVPYKAAPDWAPYPDAASGPLSIATMLQAGSVIDDAGLPTVVAGCLIWRGFISGVSLPLQGWLDHGPALVTRHPMTRVELSDRQPASDPGEKTHSWHNGTPAGHAEMGYDLPPAIFALLTGGHVWESLADDSNSFMDYQTPEDAVNAVSRACLLWARNEARKRAAPSRRTPSKPLYHQLIGRQV